MTVRRILFTLFLLCFCIGLQAHSQGGASNVTYKRTVPTDSYYQKLETTPNDVHTIRLENGQLWLNGNLQKSKDLPKSLRSIDPNYFFEARLWGQNELKFSLFGKDYLLAKGKLIEMPTATATPVNRDYNPKVANKEDYYSVYKNQAPSLWQGWQIEAQLTLECRQMLMEYELSQDRLEKRDLRNKLEKKMSLLFDLQIANEEAEIKQIEKELLRLKKELDFRRKNKQVILENQIKEITRD